MPAKKKAATKKPAAKAAPTKRAMSDDHKAALATGRRAGRAVRDYLDALETNKPKRGRRRTPESIGQRLEAIDAELVTAAPIKRLSLFQEQLDLRAELETLNDRVDLTAVEAEFVTYAKAYGEAKGISYTAWRGVGVSAAVLKAAGISRSATS